MIKLFSKLPFAYKCFIGIALAFLAMVIWDQSFWWRLKPDYSFGFLVPLLVLYVLYGERAPKIKAMLFDEDLRPKTETIPVWQTVLLNLIVYGGLAVALLLLLLGFIMRAAQGTGPQATVMIAFGISVFLLFGIFEVFDGTVSGRKWTLKERFTFVCFFIFPSLIWFLSAPMLPEVEKRISVFLLGKVAAITFGVFDLLGFQIEQQGNVLILPSGSVGVEEACSGIRSLTACLFAGSFLAAVFLKPFWKKVLLVLCAMLLAFITNLFRSFFLTGWAYAYGSQSIEGTVHDLTGYAILVVTCVILLLLLPLFNLNKYAEEGYV